MKDQDYLPEKPQSNEPRANRGTASENTPPDLVSSGESSKPTSDSETARNLGKGCLAGGLVFFIGNLIFLSLSILVMTHLDQTKETSGFVYQFAVGLDTFGFPMLFVLPVVAFLFFFRRRSTASTKHNPDH
ncbi:hypothetical protein APED_30270 [Acanthopleuribacter pedis]